LSIHANFHNDLKLDSLDQVEVLIAVEDEFKCEFSDKEADEFKTISQVADSLEKYIKEKPKESSE
ncbi:hypothetical protein ROZALSC1DRAFT_30036, partial [Rozella allomycis CSF55]